MSYDPTNDPIPVTEDDVRDAITGCYLISDDDVDGDALADATREACEAWDGDGWYDVCCGYGTWGGDDARYYGDLTDLAASLYAAMTTGGCDARRITWADKVTDPDDVADLEALYA